MASHSRQDIEEVVTILASAMRDADLEYRLGHEGEKAIALPGAQDASV